MQALKRKSFNTIKKIYFFTATIHKWLPLLAQENNQQLIIDYLKKLSDEGYLALSLGSWHTKQKVFRFLK